MGVGEGTPERGEPFFAGSRKTRARVPVPCLMMTPGGSEVETAPSVTFPEAGLRPTGAALAKCSQVAQHYPCVNT